MRSNSVPATLGSTRNKYPKVYQPRFAYYDKQRLTQGVSVFVVVRPRPRAGTIDSGLGVGSGGRFQDGQWKS